MFEQRHETINVVSNYAVTNMERNFTEGVDDATEQSIWDKMVLEEQKLEAEKRGIRVCDLEEEASLTLALEESVSKKQLKRDEKVSSKTSRKSLSAEKFPSTAPGAKSVVVLNELRKDVSGVAHDVNDEVDDIFDDQHFENEHLKFETLVTATAKGSSTVNFKTGANSKPEQSAQSIPVQELSIWQIYLPQDCSTKILSFLGDIDMCGYLHQISKTNCFRPTESVYRALCEFIYTAQSKKKKLIVENWKSWRNMLVFRPRIRTNGFYCLRTLYSRAPSNDSFWEEKITQSVEVKFYRHMRFFDDGRMLYSLDTVEPDDMAKHLTHGTEVPKKIFEGKYTLAGSKVLVEVPMHYAVVYFDLIILDGQDGYIGKYNTLRMIEHSSAAIFRGAPGGAYWGTDKVQHKLPNNTDLQFWRHWSWNSSNKEKAQ